MMMMVIPGDDWPTHGHEWYWYTHIVSIGWLEILGKQTQDEQQKLARHNQALIDYASGAGLEVGVDFWKKINQSIGRTNK